MQMLILFNSDHRPFDRQQIHDIFRSESKFHEVRFNTPGGSTIEADYVDGQDSTIVRLSDDLETLSLSGQTDAALHAAMILQRHLQGTIRIIDLDYAFDLSLADFQTIDELRAAVENAQAG
jgi:hypothetical protein